MAAFIRIFFFIIISSSGINAALANVELTTESCGDDIFGGIAEIYFYTERPDEVFEILGRNVGSVDHAGEWSSDPEIDKEFKKFFDANKINPDQYNEKLGNWKNSNKNYLDYHQTGQSKINQCTIYLQIDGQITEETFEELEAITKRYAHPPFVFVALNSPGGEVGPALKIGRLIRSLYGITKVGKHSGYVGSKGIGCFSACVLIYAAGIAKEIELNENRNGEWYPIGVHQHFLSRNQIEGMSVEESVEMLKRTKSEISSYLSEVGVPQEFLALANSINKDSLYFLSDRELRLYLPFAVSEYSTVLPTKVRQSFTQFVNLFFRGMDLAIKNIGKDAKLIEYLKELERIMEYNFELIKWGSYPVYYIEVGIYYQGLK